MRNRFQDRKMADGARAVAAAALDMARAARVVADAADVVDATYDVYSAAYAAYVAVYDDDDEDVWVPVRRASDAAHGVWHDARAAFCVAYEAYVDAAYDNANVVRRF